MRLILLGSGEFAIPTLRWLLQSEHEIPLVITQPARGSGRGRIVTPTPVARFAGEHGMEVLEVEDVNQPPVIKRLRDLDAFLGLVIAFGQKLRPELLAAFPAGCVNLHASLLPLYRGAAPINWAIINGEERTGCTVFRIVDRMDAGPILTSRWTFIKPEETAGELHDRLAGVGVDAVQSALAMHEGGAIPAGEPQDEILATKAPKLKKLDGVIEFSRPAEAIARQVCGLNPWPGAFAQYCAQNGRSEQVTLLRARPAEITDAPAEPPGTIDRRLYVTTGSGYLEVLEVKPAAGRAMSWQGFVNGRHVQPGDHLEAPSGEPA